MIAGKTTVDNPKPPENMKQIFTLIAATFIFTAVNAGVITNTDSTNINANKKAVINLTLQAAGKVTISWSNMLEETTTTVYEIQKRTDGGKFKTIAILMGESLPTYSFRDKVSMNSGAIEYRVVAFDKNVAVNTVTQNLIVL